MRRQEIPEWADKFVGGLERLADPNNPNRAVLAILKRGAGHGLEESREALPHFYGLRPPTWAEEDCFLVATLFPFLPGEPRHGGTTEEPVESQTTDDASASHGATDGSRREDFGRSLRWLARQPKVNADGVDRRFAILLDADREALPFRLRQAVRMIAQKDGRVDWRQLLIDLGHWDRPDRRVQKRWARSYYGLRADTDGQAGGAGSPDINTNPEEKDDAD